MTIRTHQRARELNRVVDRREVLHEVDEESETGSIGGEFREMSQVVLDMVINYGVMSAAMPQLPEHVQEGFVVRMRRLKSLAETEIQEVQSFGEYFDE